MESKEKIAIAIGVLVLLLGLVAYWYGFIRPTSPTGGAPEVLRTPPADLGSELYDQATNPVKDKLPESVAPIPNPIEGVYKNPFE